MPSASCRAASPSSSGRPAARARRLAISDRLWASLPPAPPGCPARRRAFELASIDHQPAPDGQGRRRGGPPAPRRRGRRPGDRPGRPRPADRRTEAEVAREIRDRLVDEGHELAEFAIVGSGPEQRLAPSRGRRSAGSGPASRSSSTSAARSMATPRTRPASSGSRGGDPALVPTRTSSACSASCARPRPRRAPPSGPGLPARTSTRRPARSSTPPATGRSSSIGWATGSASKPTRTRTS